jgi:hypothetical protein
MDRRKFLSRLIIGAAGATTGIGLAKVGRGQAAHAARETRVANYKCKGLPV